MRRLAIPLAAFALLAGACFTSPNGSAPVGAPPDGPPNSPSPAPTGPAEPAPAPRQPVPSPAVTATATPTPPPAAPAGPAEPSVFPADTRPDTSTGRGSLVTLTGIRVGHHATHDRVVLDLGGGGKAGWRVEYVDRAVADGSGEPVTVAGDRVLQVLLDHTGMPDDTGIRFYDGPRRITGPGTVAEVVLTGMFEGTTQLFIGVDGHQPFRVFAVDGRVVIDVVSNAT